MQNYRHQFARKSLRVGGATVELALCLPILILLVFGSIEASNAIFLRQGLAIAAYEAAQVASQFGGDVAAAELRGREVLDARNIQGYTIQIQPPVTNLTPTGTTVVVTVAAPVQGNSLGAPWYFRGAIVRSTVTMRRL